MGLMKNLGSRLLGSQKQPVIILGVDGAPYTLIQQFIKEGVMPNLAQIVQEGSFAQMDTSIPEVSSVAWTTFFTGVNPARHGIFGFMDLKPKSYEMYFPNSQDIQSRTLWDRSGDQGYRSVVINVPSTYPARPLSGSLISGFVAIDLAKATYPNSLLPMLEKVNYQLDVDATKAAESMELFTESLVEVLDAREKVLWDLLINEKWDLFIGVFTETDRMHHYLWEAIENSSHKFHGFFKSIYARVDRFIGRVYDWFNGRGIFMIMSDHGFCRIKKEVYLNYWLQSEGYLKLSAGDQRFYEDITPDSKAFVMDPARIYIHKKDKYPNGCVSSGDEYLALRDELKSRLLDLKINGEPVIQKVFLKEDLYEGPLMDQAPDLLLLPHWGYDLKGSLAKKELTGNTLFTGMHTRDDSTFIINQKISDNERVNIMHVAPTAAKGLGLKNMKGFDKSPLI